jgi:hypothetical protein
MKESMTKAKAEGGSKAKVEELPVAPWSSGLERLTRALDERERKAAGGGELPCSR